MTAGRRAREGELPPGEVENGVSAMDLQLNDKTAVVVGSIGGIVVRWVSGVTLTVAIIMIGWGLGVVLSQPVTAWFAASATIWMALLLISAFWQLRGSFTAVVALATAVVARLFSILRLIPPASIDGLNPQDLDLLVATGPGIPGFELLGWF